jgi:hypothetical protein
MAGGCRRETVRFYDVVRRERDLEKGGQTREKPKLRAIHEILDLDADCSERDDRHSDDESSRVEERWRSKWRKSTAARRTRREGKKEKDERKDQRVITDHQQKGAEHPDVRCRDKYLTGIKSSKDCSSGHATRHQHIRAAAKETRVTFKKKVSQHLT